MSENIATIIPRIFAPEEQWRYQLLSNWQTIFGSMSSIVQLDRIHDDMLVLAVTDACWMHELHALSSFLVSTINDNLDKPRIKQLRFRRAGLKNTKKNTEYYIPPIIIKKNIELSGREQKALNTIKDPQLAEALKLFLVRCYHERELP